MYFYSNVYNHNSIKLIVLSIILSAIGSDIFGTVIPRPQLIEPEH